MPPEAEVIYQFTNRKLRAGDRLAPMEIPANKLAGRSIAALILTVDDPLLDPPTDAMMEGTIEVSSDGITWQTIATIWAGTSGIIEARIAIAGRRVRVAGRCDLAVTIDLTSGVW